MIMFLAVLMVTVLFSGVTALADSFVTPAPAMVESEDGSHVFSFNPDNSSEFPEMGVYRNTEPLELVYAINFGSITFLNDFYFSADMKYFVHFPTITQDTVLLFYEDGILMESYRIPNLVKDKRVVSYSVSMAMWYDFNSRILDVENNTFTVTTNDDLTYVFDITTGKAIKGDIITTDEIWSPFNTMEEGPPRTPHDDAHITDLVSDLSDYITESGSVDLQLDDGQIVTVTIANADTIQPDEAARPPMDTSLLIGIIAMAAFTAGLVVLLLLVKRKK